jgi:hypothetical protein
MGSPKYNVNKHAEELRRIDEYNREADRLRSVPADRASVLRRRSDAVKKHKEAADRHAGGG